MGARQQLQRQGCCEHHPKLCKRHGRGRQFGSTERHTGEHGHPSKCRLLGIRQRRHHSFRSAVVFFFWQLHKFKKCRTVDWARRRGGAARGALGCSVRQRPLRGEYEQRSLHHERRLRVSLRVSALSGRPGCGFQLGLVAHSLALWTVALQYSIPPTQRELVLRGFQTPFSVGPARRNQSAEL